MNISSELQRRWARPEFPRSSRYDLRWVLETMMGPNVLWLAEWASEAVPLRAGMRILDLGCGKAASSIFLAREFDVTVSAVDLWVDPTENWQRIEAAGLASRILPLHAEAHALPFAQGCFDAILSFDAYHYFGTDDLYVGYVTRFLRPGGHLCIVSPGLTEELPNGPPEALRPYWEWEFCSFHSAAWWRRHWVKSGLLEVELADNLPRGWELWAEWDECCAEARVGLGEGAAAAREAEMVRKDAGRTLAFTRIVAQRKSQ